jgi:transposase-like protein
VPARLKRCSSKLHEGENPLPLTFFNYLGKSPDKRQRWCKSCNKKYLRARSNKTERKVDRALRLLLSKIQSGLTK